MTNSKHNNNKPTVRYMQLREVREENDGEEKLELHVRYEKYGVVVYSFSTNGNLGFEKYRHGPLLPVIYSEAEKTFISPNLSTFEEMDVALPNKVVRWLRDSTPLSQLVEGQGPSSKSQSKDSQTPGIEESEDMVVALGARSQDTFFLSRGSTGCTFVHENSMVRRVRGVSYILSPG